MLNPHIEQIILYYAVRWVVMGGPGIFYQSNLVNRHLSFNVNINQMDTITSVATQCSSAGRDAGRALQEPLETAARFMEGELSALSGFSGMESDKVRLRPQTITDPLVQMQSSSFRHPRFDPQPWA